ncbi:hypothetical protein, partial [Gluconobacter kondonii]|uniref:hypothetical protein n=1 Tax=Gluconobacter kondonii TaxID=941463 RepID=UPI00222F0A13
MTLPGSITAPAINDATLMTGPCGPENPQSLTSVQHVPFSVSGGKRKKERIQTHGVRPTIRKGERHTLALTLR